MKKWFASWLVNVWYKDPFFAVWLIPFSMIYHDIVKFRRYLYRIGLKKSHALPVPVIVAGNITVGGTGKTPFVIWLSQYLQKAGYKPGIISRGYGGQAEQWPQKVTADSDPLLVGDEALLLAQHCQAPVAVGPSRLASGQMLLASEQCDIIISDDGLQHYALKRDIEILLIDGSRRFGNGALLPGGPLREPVSRIREVDLLLCNGGEPEEDEFLMQMQTGMAVHLGTGKTQELQTFVTTSCHAVAGIGNPKRFFNTLQQVGIESKNHIFPDHHHFNEEDLQFNDEKAVLMTEKDAVKCRTFNNDLLWYVPVQAALPEDFCNALDNCLKKLAESS